MWHRDRKWANAVGKMVPTDLLNAALPQMFNLFKNAVAVKNNKTEHNRTSCDCH